MKSSTQIQYIHDQSGNPTAAVVPMKVWREYEQLKAATAKKGKRKGETETEYIMRSPAMVKAILEASQSKERYSLEEVKKQFGIK